MNRYAVPECPSATRVHNGVRPKEYATFIKGLLRLTPFRI